MTFEEAWVKAEQIEGWLFKEEADLLWRYCCTPWVEVGCYKGKSTSILADTGARGYAIDWFKGSPEHPEGTDTLLEFERNLGLRNNVYVIEQPLESAWRTLSVVEEDALGFLHLDADHDLEMTAIAFALYAPLLRSGGFLVFHDAWGERGPGSDVTPWPGVTKFVEALKTSDRWDHIEDVKRCAVFQRVS